METVLNWLARNKEWFLSGIGISIPLAIVGWFVSRKAESKPTGISGGSSNIGIGRDMNVGGDVIIQGLGSGETARQIQKGQLALFRDTITSAAWEWEHSMNKATESAESDPEASKAALETSTTALRTIVVAYRHNKHLFEEATRGAIDTLLEDAEKSGDGLTELITAIQLINCESERLASAFA